MKYPVSPDQFAALNLRSCHEMEYLLLGDLRDLLEDIPNEITRRWMLVVLDALLETLPRGIQLKDEDGYLNEVIKAFPNWSDQVDALRREHDILFGKLRRLRERIVHRAHFTDIANETRNDLKEWIQTLVAHHRHETRLLQTAVNLEVGIGD
ncbi:MAG: hemerythrin domain-containing protein [Planctomycetaceae bacterium]